MSTTASVVCWWFLVASVFPPFYSFPWSAWLTWRAVGSAAGGEIFLCKNKILLRAGGFVPPVEQEWFDGRKSPAFRVLRGASWNNNDPLKLRSSVRVEPPTHPRRFPWCGESSGTTSPAAPRQAPGLEPVETAGRPNGGRGTGQQPELRGEGRAEAVTGDW